MIETTWAEVNLDNIKSNYINIRNKVKESVRICGVVKANAYGHGAIDVARVLEREGVDFLAVARLEEGIELRKNGILVPILCLGYICEENYAEAIKYDITITVFSFENAKQLNSVAKNLNKKCTVHLKIDTGMGRLGFEPTEEVVNQLQEISKFESIYIEGIYTHFSKVDELDKSYTYKQIEKFDFVCDKLKERQIKIPIKHVSNSAGILDLNNCKYDMVRCGIILYGHYPSEYVDMEKINIKPAISLKTKVAYVKKVNEGDKISYGCKYAAVEEAYIATLPIGYADGFFRGQQDPQVEINGRIYRVVGRICMDQCMVDLGSNSDGIKQGDEVLVYGDDKGVRVEEVAGNISSINYEVLCAISRRVDRVYIENGTRLSKSYILG